MTWKSSAHMTSGLKAAIASPKTPKHLIPHLEARMSNPLLSRDVAQTAPKPMKPVMKTLVVGKKKAKKPMAKGAIYGSGC